MSVTTPPSRAADGQRARAGTYPAERLLTRLGILALAIAGGTALGFIVWARDRGFGLRDEGYYLINYRWADRTDDIASQFHRVVDLVSGPLGLNVVDLRMTRLVIVVATSALLALAFHRFARSRLTAISDDLPVLPATVLFCILAGLLGYTWLPQTLGYNDLVAALLYVECALLFLGLANAGRRRPVLVLCPLGIGFLASIHFFVKAPGAVLVLAALALAAAALILDLKAALRWVAAMAGGTVFGFLVLTEIVGLGVFRVRDLIHAAGVTTGDKHSVATLARSYVVDLRDDLQDVVLERPWRLIALVAIIAGIAVATRPGISRRARAFAVASVVGGSGVVLAEVVTLSGHYFELPANYGLLLALLLVMPMTALVFALLRGWRPPAPRTWWREPVVVTVALLMALPFLNAAGTNVNIMLVAMTSGAVFGCALLAWIAIVTTNLSDATSSGAVRFVVLVVVGSLFALQVIIGTIARPYELPTNLFEASALVDGIPPLEGLRLDPQSKKFLEDLQAEVETRTDFEAGDRVLALEGMPGVTFALDGRPANVAFNTSCASLRRERASIRKARLVLLNASEKLPPLERCLSDIWHRFPEGLEEVARIPSPYDPGGTVRVLAVPKSGSGSASAVENG